MAFRLLRGKTVLKHFPKSAAATGTTGDLTEGDLVKLNAAGQVVKCVSGAAENVLGVARKTTSGDTTTDSYPVQVPLEDMTEWEADADDTAVDDSDVGKYVDLDTTGAKVDIDASTYDTVLVTGKVAANKVRCVLHRTVRNPNVADITT